MSSVATKPAAPPGSPERESAVAPLSQRRIWLVFGGLVLALVMAVLDQSIVNPALPTIVGDLRGLRDMQWVVTGYLLTTTAVLPLYGKLGDLIGYKPVFLFAIATFLVGSMLSGLSQNMTELIAFRALQGVGAGGLLIGVMTIAGLIVAARERAKYMAVIMLVNSISTVAGPLLGGFFTDHVSWRWCFYVNLPIGIAALAVVASALPGTGERRRFELDIAGAALLAAASACLVLLASWGGSKYAWDSWQIVGLGAGCLLATAFFLVAEARANDPVLPLRLFKDPAFTYLGLIAFAAGFALLGAMAFVPTFLQMVDNISATTSGLFMLPMIGGLLVSSLTAGQVMSRTGRYKALVVLGTAVLTVGTGLLSLMSADSTRLENGVYLAVFGLGAGLVMPVLITAVQNAAPRRELGVATSTNNFLRQIGSTLGAAVVGTLFVNRLTGLLASDLPRGAAVHITNVNAITPSLVHRLPATLQAAFVHAYASALPPIFLYLVPLLGAAFVLAWLVKEVPLRGGQAAPEVPPPG